MRDNDSNRHHRNAAISAVILTLGLFVIGGRPEAGQVFQGIYHWLAHLGAYGLIAVAYCLALPRLAWPFIAAMVAGIGAVHEFYEITAHSHDYEYLDALVNGIGATIGALIGWAILRRRTNAIR